MTKDDVIVWAVASIVITLVLIGLGIIPKNIGLFAILIPP